ncbi:MAG: sulfite exporter TauE/SafE family protein [Magnetococcales bacterium]|nr:sulfite exporter TauE/SafE family protein [Magnetococcales bacterium]
MNKPLLDQNRPGYVRMIGACFKDQWHSKSYRLVLAVWLALTLLWNLTAPEPLTLSLADEQTRHAVLIALFMVFGSFVAGSTSVGGGVVAYPILIGLFSVTPVLARDYSLAIQSVGMTFASYIIYQSNLDNPKKNRKLPVALRIGLIGAVIGTLVGIIGIERAQLMQWPEVKNLSPQIKLAFVCLITGFISIHYLRLFYSGPHLLPTTFRPQQTPHLIRILIGAFIGGIISSFFGTGADIFLFTILALYFRLPTSQATAISIMVMAASALTATLTLIVFQLSQISWPSIDGVWSLASQLQSPLINYWWCSIIAVTLGAPSGSRFLDHLTKYRAEQADSIKKTIRTNELTLSKLLYAVVIGELLLTLTVLSIKGFPGGLVALFFSTLLFLFAFASLFYLGTRK